MKSPGGEEIVLILLSSTQAESYSRFELIREQVKNKYRIDFRKNCLKKE
jgi:GGDEF domain-containing protein